MGFFDFLGNLLGNGQQDKQQSSGAASSSTPAATTPATTQPTQQPAIQLSDDQQKLAAAMGILAPVIIQKETNQADQRRVDQLKTQAQIIYNTSSQITSDVISNLNQQKAASAGMLQAEELYQLAQLDQIAKVDKRAADNQQMYREQLDPLNAAINEDTKDIGAARELQNSGNPLKWLWGKVKEEYNQETLKENIQYKSAIEQQQTADFANNTAERQLNTQAMVDASRKQILATSMVKQLQAGEQISAKQLDFLAKQFELSHKEMSDIYQGMQIDLSKKQLSYQGAYLKIAAEQEKRAKEEWASKQLDERTARTAAKNTFQQMKDANALGGLTEAQITDSYLRPKEAAGSVVMQIQRFQGLKFADASTSAGAAGSVSYKEVGDYGTAAVNTDSGRFYLDIKNQVDADQKLNEQLANPMFSDATKQQMKESAFQRLVQQKMSDAHSLIANNMLTVPTVDRFAQSNNNLVIANQKAFDALRAVQGTISADKTANSTFISNVVKSAETSNVPLDAMANQMTSYYKQIAAENFRQKKIPANMSKFYVNMGDDFSGSLNSFTGTFNSRTAAVDMMDPRQVYNLLSAARKRQKTQAALEAQQQQLRQQLQQRLQQQLSVPVFTPANIQFGMDSNKPTVNVKEY